MTWSSLTPKNRRSINGVDTQKSFLEVWIMVIDIESPNLILIQSYSWMTPPDRWVDSKVQTGNILLNRTNSIVLLVCEDACKFLKGMIYWIFLLLFTEILACKLSIHILAKWWNEKSFRFQFGGYL